jgi:predicted dehydrogenase
MADASPSNKLGVAVVGGDGMGGYSTEAALRERFVALVEVEDSRMARVMGRAEKSVAEGGVKPKTFVDYRKMLDECHKDIDVVLIATPDHNHAPAAIRAINLGKAVFCQKPMAYNIYECYTLAKAAKEKKVLTQMGNQGHCGEAIRRACEYIWAGAVGNITETHTILGRNFGGKGGRPESKPVPEGLHWDEWLGPAPYRDYHDGLHPFSWRSWRQFGTGTIGDMACHNYDVLFWALKIRDAKQFTVECLSQTPGSDEQFPTDNVYRWEIPARGDMPAVKVHSYDHGNIRPEIMKEVEQKFGVKWGECTLYVGDKGLMRTGGTAGSFNSLPEDRIKDMPAPEKTLPRANGGPIQDLFHAMRNDGTPCSNFVDSAAWLTSFALTGLLASFAGPGKKIEWDVEKMQCTNLPEINQYVRREYRKGWEV